MIILEEVLKTKRNPNDNYFNEYVIKYNYAEFYIINRKKEKFTVQVDFDILERLIQFNRSWNAKWSNTAKTYYACCCEYLGTIDGKPKYKIHYLHRWIMNAKDDEYVDHIKQKETLNNRRSNLRLTTNSKNNEHRKGKNINNVTGYRNVMYNKAYPLHPYVVQLQINGKNTVLGKFANVDEAGDFAKRMRHKYYGEFEGNG